MPRGTGKKKRRPRTFAEPNQKAPTHLLLFFFPPACFFIAFSGVSQQVEFKNTKKTFFEKFHFRFSWERESR
jgi:hypothetical protein